MKFCPLCQRDFDDNIVECPECGETLLNGTYLENPVIFDYQSEELVLKLFNYLCENDFKSIQYYHNTQTDRYCITASSEENINAKQALLLCLEDEDASLELTEHEREIIIKQISDMIHNMIPDEGAKTFINAKERYDDMMSSASSLIVVGLLGFVFVALVYFKIIRLEMNVLFYILSLFMFSAFIITGIFSFLKARKIKSLISTEESLSEQIKDFLLKEYNPSVPENFNEANISEEEKYFTRTEYMKKMVLEHFENPDELLVDGMIEEVYNDIYPAEETNE